MQGIVSEIFRSIQGEGIYCGSAQTFVRFFGCNLRCRFCDTLSVSSKPYSAQALVRAVQRISPAGFGKSVCITGGEPLCQADFLKDFLRLLKKKHYAIYLETNGTLPDEFEKVVRLVDVVAMDIKLPSATGCGEFWRQHARFLSIAKQKCVFVKIVITRSTTRQDVNRACALVFRQARDCAVVLQPEYRQMSRPFIQQCLEFQSLCLRKIPDVRVIPQLHKFLSIA